MRVNGLHHDLTYWAPGGEDRYGNQSFAAPILIKGRWEDRSEEVNTIGGERIVSKAIVFVDRDTFVGGYLAQGDHTAVTDPDLAEGSAEIQAFSQIPDLRNVSTLRKAVL